jgi:hypothetical protein
VAEHVAIQADGATFKDLPVGAFFRFFTGGALLTKSGKRQYDSPPWGHFGLWVLDFDQPVISEMVAA